MIENAEYTKTLQYASPCHGDWGIVRIAAQVPESHQLFVCPSACGRHGALGAIQHGYKNRLSYLYIDKADIITGYDDAILQGIDALLQHLVKRPKAVFIYVSCLDDLIGTDHEALCLELSKKHKDIDFRFGHMNPISLDGKRPPVLTTFEAMFSLLKKRETSPTRVNTIGNLLPVDSESELFCFLKYHGMTEAYHISDFASYEDFHLMSSAHLNLLLAPAASAAARDMERRLGIPYIPIFTSCDLDEIEKNYTVLEKYIDDGKRFDFKSARMQAENAINKALNLIGDTPIVVGVGAVVRPCSLAWALVQYGFNVKALVLDKVVPSDHVAYEQLENTAVTIRRISPQHYDYILFENQMPNCIAIGFEASYITKTKHIVPLCDDEGMFGYHALVRLMEMLSVAAKEEIELKPLLDKYGGIV